MIIIAFIYLVIALLEWSDNRSKKRKKRTRIIVFGSIAILFLLSEVVFGLRDHFQLAVLIEYVFGPLDHFMLPQQSLLE